ncbi:hypothetical protein [Lysinibacillus agricola]|uniref:hypothetical protein n=1 Tax=Lysinibacillus agricola TaxID=2590012 RepID=UPI003C16C174
MNNQSNFNKKSLIKLTEQYLTTTILQKNIIGFLQDSTHKKHSTKTLLAERAGKSANTIYKNINELELYNAASLLRYWVAMVDVCREIEVEESKIPNLNDLLSKYEEILYFLNHITTEDQIEMLIDTHLDAFLEIIVFYQSHKKLLTDKEDELLEQLMAHPTIIDAFTQSEQQQKDALLERMKKK